VPAYLQAGKPPAEVRGDADADEESQAEGLVPLADQLWRDSIYCALHADADAAFDPDSESYTFAEGGVTRSQAELVDHYAELCQAEPLLRVLVQPLSQSDAASGGLVALRARLPPEVLLVQELAPDGASVEDCPGQFRDVALTPLGLAAHCVSHPQFYSERCGLYDFAGSEAAGRLPLMGAYLDVSMALPDRRRLFLLPKLGAKVSSSGQDAPNPPAKGGKAAAAAAAAEAAAAQGPEEPPAHLQALDAQICRMITTAYRQRSATDGREKMRSLNFKQWSEGLRRLGYDGVDQYAEALFQFLDVSNNGSISTKELKVMEGIDGPASLRELDELRIWLCDWQEQREKLRRQAEQGTDNAGQAASSPAGSPLTELWLRMDANGSGNVSFGEFRRALRRMKHPDAMEGRDGKLQELFMCLDLKSDGNIGEAEFHCLAVLSAKFQLERVVSVRDFLKGRFGTLKAAFKAMDENRSGTLSKEEWMDVMKGRQSYPVQEDCVVCFQFFDKDNSQVLSGKEFELLGTFDQGKLLDDAQALCDLLVERHGSLEAAFDALRPPSMGPARPGLDFRDFLAGLEASEFQCSVDPRLLFNFLDAMHVGCVTRNEFVQMGKLDAVDELQERTELMQGAISSLKAFMGKFFEASPPEGGGDLWALLHQELRNVTHGDIDLW